MTMLLPGSVVSSRPAALTRAFSNAAQVLTAATEAIILGTAVQIPDTGLKVGDRYRVRLALDKTGAGTATSAYKVAVIADGAAVAVANVLSVLSFAKPAGTAAADEGEVEILVVITAIGPAAENGAVIGQFKLVHNLAATGHAQIPVVSIAGSDASTATILAGRAGGYLCLTITTGAADVSSVHWAEAVLESV